MRPKNVTDDDIREWEEDRLNNLTADELIVPTPPEVWYAGCWLFRELKAAGCDTELSLVIARATGQRHAYSDDHWQTAQTALDNYKKGIWERPGEELAKKLIAEKYGDPPDAKRMIADLIRAGADPEKLMILAIARHMGKPVPE